MGNWDLGFLSSLSGLWILGVVAALVTGFWVYYRLAAPLGFWTRNLLRLTRVLALLIILLMLLEPIITRTGRGAGRPHLAVLVDRSSSMLLPGADGETRAESAAEALGLLSQRLGDTFALDIYGFSDVLTPHTGESQYPWVPRGVTALGEILEETLLQQAETPAGGIVLLTDGVHTSGKDPSLVARNLPVPVFAVVVGDTTAPADVLLRQVRAQQIGYTGEPVGVRAILQSWNSEGAQVRLRVQRMVQDGDRYTPAAQAAVDKTVRLPRDRGRDLEVQLEFLPAQIGLNVYQLSAISEQDETVTINNTRLFAVEVREKKTRILYIECEPDWDYSFMRRTLDADTSLAYTYLVHRAGGRLDRFGADGPDQIPTRYADFAPFAAVVIGKGTPALISQASLAALREFVAQGGGLLLLGDPKEGGGEQFARSLGEMLPVQIGTDRRHGYTESAALLAPAGEAHNITGAYESGAGDRREWAALPPIWIREGNYSVADGTTVLLSAHTARPVREVPLFSLGHFGDGRVAVFAGRGFWRWDFLVRPISATVSPVEDFWTRTMRWVSEPSSKELFLVNPARHVFQDSEPIVFNGLLHDAAHQPVIDARVDVVMEPVARFAPDGSGMTVVASDTDGQGIETASIQLYPTGQAGRYSGAATAMQPGMYRYRASTGTDVTQSWDGVFWVEPMGPEFYELAASPRLPLQLARISGGVSLPVDSLMALCDSVPELFKPVRVVRQAELWNHWLVFGSLIGLLAFEWILRRRRGLA
jgi:hypothetical protein